MDEGEYKFTNCKHRTANEDVYMVKTCCGHLTKWGFLCTKLNVGGVLPVYCAGCEVFEARDNEHKD